MYKGRKSVETLIKKISTRTNDYFSLGKSSNCKHDSFQLAEYEYDFLKTTVNLKEVITINNIKNMLQSNNDTSRILREVKYREDIIVDNRYILEKYNIRTRRVNKERLEVNYLFAIPCFIYTYLGEVYTYTDYGHKIGALEYLIMINLFSGLVCNTISNNEFKSLISLTEKDPILFRFVEKFELKDDPRRFRHILIQLLSSIYDFISDKKSDGHIELKSINDFRFIYHANSLDNLKKIDEGFKFNIKSNNGIINIIEPKIFTDDKFITDYYKSLIDIKPSQTDIISVYKIV